MAHFRRLGTSGRFAFRFLCAAWLAGSAAILRLWAAAPSWPPERRLTELIVAFAVCAVLGALLLWRTRESGARELVETSAALGFWAGVFALIV
jgi:hypothetical protein